MGRSYRGLPRWTVIATCTALGLVALLLALGAPWTGRDLAMFLDAGHRMAAGQSPYADPLFRYSPAFAALVAMLPSGAVSLAVWRTASVAALALSLRGATTPLTIAVIAPAVVFDLASGNVTCFALALMIAVLRWPSVRTAAAYAVFVVLVPKPAFLPVLLYAFVTIPAARRSLVLVGLAGAAMLAVPGYAGALLAGGGETGFFISSAIRLPAVATVGLVACGVVVAVLGLRWPRVLGAASVLVSGYWFPYVFAPLALTTLPPGSRLGQPHRWRLVPGSLGTAPVPPLKPV